LKAWLTRLPKIVPIEDLISDRLVHDFLAECITKLEAIQIAVQRQIGPKFGVEQGLIRRFKLAIK
jgi:hypothetical protein